MKLIRENWPGVFAVVMLAFFIYAGWKNVHDLRTYTFTNLYVKQQTGDLEFWFVPEHADAFHTTLCPDYPITFKSGMTLGKAVFLDEGQCWSLNPNKHAGYYILRDTNGKPIITDTNVKKGTEDGQPVAR